ncbi:ClpX C4-type zinc finger protein [Ornithinimicrobium sp. Y1694]|uniref:ClpX C4-type zinc finger protein n=1 Tax=Ornithinimicrobium sp. Y1694 TaxID=3418590 RepID=UPI003CF55E36
MLSEVLCSYCLRSRDETGRLVASPLAAICRSCAEQAVNLFDSDPRPEDLDGPTTPWARLDDDALLARLPEVAAAGTQVETHLTAWVHAARDRGLSWARIGEALGMTRQSAWERFNGAIE